jgi:hypothetical protein
MRGILSQNKRVIYRSSKVTPKETRELNKHLEAAAAILFKNTPREKLQDFESLELALRDQLTKHVHPTFGHFFYAAAPKQVQEESEKSKPV